MQWGNVRAIEGRACNRGTCAIGDVHAIEGRAIGGCACNRGRAFSRGTCMQWGTCLSQEDVLWGRACIVGTCVQQGGVHACGNLARGVLAAEEVRRPVCESAKWRATGPIRVPTLQVFFA